MKGSESQLMRSGISGVTATMLNRYDYDDLARKRIWNAHCECLDLYVDSLEVGALLTYKILCPWVSDVSGGPATTQTSVSKRTLRWSCRWQPPNMHFANENIQDERDCNRAAFQRNFSSVREVLQQVACDIADMPCAGSTEGDARHQDSSGAAAARQSESPSERARMAFPHSSESTRHGHTVTHCSTVGRFTV